MKLRKVVAAFTCLAAVSPVAWSSTDLHRVVWIDDPATKATIAWRQVSGDSQRVEYGTSSDGTGWSSQNVDEAKTLINPRDVPEMPLVSQFVHLQGLTPDTAYYFKVCDSEGCTDNKWFKTAPNTPTEYTFVAGGDSRTNRKPRQDGMSLVSKIRPLFVLFNGDFNDDGTHDEWVEWLTDWQLSESEDGRVYPIVATHGNHENDTLDMLNYIFGIPAGGYYALNVGGDMMRIYTLNSEAEPGVGYGAYNDQDETVWNAQTNWLATDAAANTSKTWLVGNYHRPMRPHTSGKSEGTGRIEAWAQAFADSAFDLIVESDTHLSKYTFPVVKSDAEGSFQDFKRDDANGVMIIGEGSWGAPTRPTDDDKPWTMDSGSFWQFKLVQAQPDVLDIYTVRFGSEHDEANGISYDPSTVTAITQADQDANALTMPTGLDLWKPLSGESIQLKASGFEGAKIDNLQLVGSGATWKYLDNGTSPEGWNQAGFDDAAWSSGAAQFGYGDGDETTEVGFGGDSENKHITTYFRRTFTIANPEDVIKLNLRLLRDDGAVVYINGQEVTRSNMPEGTITSTTPASSGIGGSAESSYYELSLMPESLQAGENTIAVEIHQSDSTSSDLSFDLDLTAVVSNVEEALPAVETMIEANPLSVSEIELTWSDAENFDEVGYQLERKTAEGSWEIVSWRIDPNATTFTDVSLQEGQTYSYRVRPYNSSGLTASSNEATTATLTNPVPKIYEETFESGSLGEITVFSVASNADWALRESGGAGVASMNGYGADVASDDWMFIKPINLDYYASETLAFDIAYNYGGPLLAIKYSVDYDPSQNADPASATWMEVPVCSDAEETFCWQLPGEGSYTFETTTLDISELTGNVSFAFHYTSTGTGGGEGRIWQVDNIVVRGNYEPPVLTGDDFESGIPSSWTAHSGASDKNWEGGTEAGENAAVVNGFGGDAASRDWLITPATVITEDDNARLEFDYFRKYGGPGAVVRISLDYAGGNPEEATWTDLDINLPGENDLNDAWMHIGPVDISSYVGTVHVAFYYETTGTGPGDGAITAVDNVKITKNLDFGIEAVFSADGELFTTIEPVTFVATISGGSEPFNYTWDFGDGNTSTEASPSHTYEAAGTYTVNLTVTDADNDSVEVTQENIVEVLQATVNPVPSELGDLRIATFNAYLNRATEGQILTDSQSGTDPQIKKVAEIIQRVRPDVLLLQEFDYVADGSAVAAFQENYLNVKQNDETETINYQYVYLAESNTGILTEFDFDNDGQAGNGGGDSYGFGVFPGQYAMVLLSQYPIVTDQVRTFQKFLWKDMPDAKLPVDPTTGEPWFSEEELNVFRLSSKSHWDVPIQVGDEVIHVLASHPTPPVFDGDEDRNGTRNHDEIRFWADYIDPDASGYIYDDNGGTGGLGANQRFVIMGDQNASTLEGDATDNPMALLLDNDRIIDANPQSQGGIDNDPENENAPYHTADWKIRVDYVLPSSYGLEVEQTAVFWPGRTDVLYGLVSPGVQSSDHRLVYADLDIVSDGGNDDDDDDGFFGSFDLFFLTFATLVGLSRRRFFLKR